MDDYLSRYVTYKPKGWCSHSVHYIEYLQRAIDQRLIIYLLCFYIQTVVFPPSSLLSLFHWLPLSPFTLWTSPSFHFRKQQGSYGYKPGMVYQVAVKTGTSSAIKARQGNQV